MSNKIKRRYYKTIIGIVNILLIINGLSGKLIDFCILKNNKLIERVERGE